jgi:site-specific recombinase XerD
MVTMTIIAFPTSRAGATRRPTPPALLADLIADFTLDLAVIGRQPRTIGEHTKELRRYGRWLDSRELHWHDAVEDDLVVYLRTRAHLTSSTRAATICSLRVFHAWLVKRRYLVASPAADLTIPRRGKPTPKALSRAQLRLLLAYLRGQEGLRARRDEILVLTGLYTGLRAAELAALKWSDIDLDEGSITIELSKMNHGRATAAPPSLITRLRRWQAIQAPPSAYVFGNLHDGSAIVAERAGKIVRRIAEAIGIPDLHTHRLRHSFATWVLRESKDLYAVSKALGHAELKQTEIYVAAALGIEPIARAVAMLPAPDDW